MTGHHGLFYRYLDMETGTRSGDVEVSTVDSALLMSGMLFAQAWFDGTEEGEVEIRALVDRIYARMDWRWFQPRPPVIVLGWTPEEGHLPYDWRGYNEAMAVYLLALASPTFPVEPESWNAWTQGNLNAWGAYHDIEHVGFAPLFGHQYTHVWFDFRGIQDEFMRARSLDYFENSRRATLAQREYCIANPGRFPGYGPDIWGLTACDGPGSNGTHGYIARGAPPAENDDGTIALTAVGGSLPFAPQECIRALRTMYDQHRENIWCGYGFRDAFNLKENWFATDVIGIDQGPILLMAENLRTGKIWERMRQNEILQRGLKRAGFQPVNK